MFRPKARKSDQVQMHLLPPRCCFALAALVWPATEASLTFRTALGTVALGLLQQPNSQQAHHLSVVSGGKTQEILRFQQKSPYSANLKSHQVHCPEEVAMGLSRDTGISQNGEHDSTWLNRDHQGSLVLRHTWHAIFSSRCDLAILPQLPQTFPVDAGTSPARTKPTVAEMIRPSWTRLGQRPVQGNLGQSRDFKRSAQLVD